MFDSLFDTQLIFAGLAIIGFLSLFSVVGLLLVRRLILPRLGIDHHDSHFSGSIVHSVMVFYGLAVALIAVNVFETYTDAEKTVSQEASAMAALYRDVETYPDKIRPSLQAELTDYDRFVINEAWPAQRIGKSLRRGDERLDRFQNTLVSFEPASQREALLHAEAFKAYNQLIDARQMRIDAVKTGLPGVMWMVVILGAFISLIVAFFFRVDDVWLHAILVTMLAVFIGLVIFMVFALDRPFRGDLGISSEPYQLVYDELMNR
jgi:hypothetical protein